MPDDAATAAAILNEPKVPYGDPPQPASAPADPRAVPGSYRFSLAQYHAMIARGILSEDDGVELIGGRLIYKMSVNPPHAAGVRAVRRVLASLIDPDSLDLHQESPVSLADSELEPDLTVVARREDDYASAHPTPADVSLVVEVADVSLERDRLVKRPLYAAAGIAEYWIVNLRDRRLERYTAPEPARADVDQAARYATAETFAEDAALEHPDLGTVAVGALLPRA